VGAIFPCHLFSLQQDSMLWYHLEPRGAPEMERTEGFDRAACRLPELRVEGFEGWIFASFAANAPPLAPQLEGLRKVIAPYRPAALRTAEPLEFEHDWDWKVMVENFLESYHHMGTHRDTLQPLVPAAGTHGAESDGPWAILYNPTGDGAPIPPLFPATAGLTDVQRAGFVVGAIFPCHLFSLQQDSMLWYHLEPRGAQRFRLRIHPCVPEAALQDAELRRNVDALRGFVDTIHRQDIEACQGVQAGLRSRLAEPGRLSHLERCVWQLHQYVRDRLGEA